MKEIFLVSSENKAKAEEAVKKDDLVSRSSIVIRSAASLEIKEDGYFIIIDGNAEAVKKAEELLKNLAKKYKKKEQIEKKLQEQEESAITGFGNILGD
jgi:copper(I)-binding protein